MRLSVDRLHKHEINSAGIIALVTIYTAVIKGENVLQGLRQDSGWSPHKMFNDVVYLEGDKDFQSYVKYLLKYGFYHYGIEVRTSIL